WVQSLEWERVQRLWRGLAWSDAAVGAETPVEVPRDARKECGRAHQARIKLGEVEDLDAAQADSHREQVLTVGGWVAQQVDRHQARVGNLVAGARVHLMRDGAQHAEVVFQPVHRTDSGRDAGVRLELGARVQLR